MGRKSRKEEPGLELSSSNYTFNCLSTVTFCGFPALLVVALMLRDLVQKMEGLWSIAGGPGRVLHIFRLLRCQGDRGGAVQLNS